ncbi:MAG: hypothetical protein A2020_10980 [Lentisphaerae bacterium GWF2_45_14]|nr:MAG: hypothetical protein A2020_10980 [Lentisphaerae bacterium GWF2_45_14]
MGNGIVRAAAGKITQIPKINSFCAIGDPGCDGLGAAAMGIFARALNIENADLNIIVGDIVPHGSRPLYENMSEFINSTASTPVYTICGNHDTAFFDEYFGPRNYALSSDGLLIVLLDNSSKSFSSEALSFFREILQGPLPENVAVFFHIPPPNSLTSNSMKNEAWAELREVYLPFREKIKYFVCGHVHSFFTDAIDGIPLIVTGGGGARIEPLNNDFKNSENVSHHVVRFYFDNTGKLVHEFIALENLPYTKEISDEKLAEYLQNAFMNECAAHFKYKLYAESAAGKNNPGLAALFKALSDSEYRHAKNHYYVMGKSASLEKYLKDSAENENYEISVMYKDYMEYAAEKGHGLAKYSFFDALNAEKVHKKLLEEALDKLLKKEKIPVEKYFTCTSCGNTFRANDAPHRCPVCGAPRDKINECV